MTTYKPDGDRWRLPNGLLRPNKAAAGFTYTATRRRQPVADHLLQLAVYGTFDTLAGMFGNRMKRHRHRHFQLKTVSRWVRR